MPAAAALAHIEETLPDLDDVARQALALVDLVGRTRPELHAETGIAENELADALARARKALRRAAFPLPGTGWCERAERLLSDELDGVLGDPGPRRLAAHLANCDRCVEHERRLWQARDQLVVSFEAARADAAPGPKPTPPVIADGPDREPVEIPDPQPEPPKRPEAELRLVEPVAEVPAPSTPTPADPPPGAPEPAEPEPAEPEPAMPEPEPAEPVPAAGTEALSDAAREPGFSLRGLAWNALLAATILLAIVSLALTLFAIAGGGI